MTSARPLASRDAVSRAIEEIRVYHEQGRESLERLPEQGKYGEGAIDRQARKLGWNVTRLRKARQFAHPEQGYSQRQLDELCRLLRKHRPRFGISQVSLLVTVSWPEREQFQRLCIENNWSNFELQAELKKRYGSRRQGGRRRRVDKEPGSLLLQLDKFTDTWRRWYAVVTEENEDQKAILPTLPRKVRARVEDVNEAVKGLREAVTAQLDKMREKSGHAKF